jgi:hypothetical protein
MAVHARIGMAGRNIGGQVVRGIEGEGLENFEHDVRSE